MAFGFGFNKSKVLQTAERYVQQGKLQNAINEYEKVLKEDVRDLTVMNTMGDLYARVGRTEQAIQCFKKVGDTYAADGFTVKAIALYKKVAKLDPMAGEYALKLAELYSQQGLFNDARAQYVLVVDQHLRAGKLENAAKIFHRMLEMDPENAALQSRLADLYLKMGKHQEARNIYLTASESLYSRGALDAADNALARVLSLDPEYTPALMLRGQIASESGKAAAAVEFLEKVPNLDSHADALRALLKSQLQLGNTAEAVPLATKMLIVHNDLSGITAVANALMTAGEFEGALRLYHQHCDRLLAANTAGLLEGLYACVERIKHSAEALELLRELFQKAGEVAHLNEIHELLAHAYVQGNELSKARDLYRQLAELEPENPLHAQNYKQILSRLGEDSAARPLNDQERVQAFMVDELEMTAPAIEQDYTDEVKAAVGSALTDSELLESYNLPARAIAPLEAALALAPNDAMLNQRLASLYARVERFPEAARSCDALRRLYLGAGYLEPARQYGEMAAKYRKRAVETPAEAEMPVASAWAPEAITLEPVPAPQAPPEPYVIEPALPAEPAQARAIDLSAEWEEAVSGEPIESIAEVPEALPESPASEDVVAAAVPDAVADLLEEIKFYLSQSMLEEAQAALEKCMRMAPGLAEVAEIRRQLESARAAQPALSVEVEVAGEAASESTGEASVSTLVFDESALALAAADGMPTEQPGRQEIQPVVQEPAFAASTPVSPSAAIPGPARHPAAGAADELNRFVAELEHSLGADFPSAEPVPETEPVALPQPPRLVPAVAEAPLYSHAAGSAASPAPTSAAAAAVAEQPLLVMTATTPSAETESPLADVFAEFKEALEHEQKAEENNDPERHYNMGVAFREMGLLEEAIGELQKVCAAIERGHGFAQAIHAYTWLAHCLRDKGAPQAAVRWYEKALRLPDLDDQSRLGVYYELAAAYEAAGNKQAALAHFMEVYAANIDYRDVAERIKSLKP